MHCLRGSLRAAPNPMHCLCATLGTGSGRCTNVPVARVSHPGGLFLLSAEATASARPYLGPTVKEGSFDAPDEERAPADLWFDGFDADVDAA